MFLIIYIEKRLDLKNEKKLSQKCLLEWAVKEK